MSTQHVQGVGIFKQGSGYWESEPASLQGASPSIESAVIEAEAEARAQAVCGGWQSILQVCLQFIEERRAEYHLQAKEFSNPNVFVQSGRSWSVYFDTEVESEAVVGVEFNGSEPFQLIIGD